MPGVDEQMHISDADVQRIVAALEVSMRAAVCPHECQFSQFEAQGMHEFARKLQNGGIEKFGELLAIADLMRQGRKVMWFTLLAMLATAVAGLVWQGFVGLVRRGG